jgi:hypothetical protein
MFALNTAIFAFTVYWIASKARYNRDQTTTLLIAGSAALPLYAVLILGHLTFLGMLFLSLFAVDWRHGGKTRTGLWAGLLLFKPTLLPIPLLLLLWKKQWKAIAAFVATTCTLLLISLALIGWDGLLKNAAMLRLMGSDYLLPMTHSLRGLAFALRLGIAVYVMMALAVVAALWIAVVRAQNKNWTMAGAMLAILLVPPYMQYHDLAIGFIAIALALMAAESIPDITRNSLFLFVLAVCAVTFANLKTDRLFPIMPIALIVCFAFCLRKAFSDTGNEAIFLGASHSE